MRNDAHGRDVPAAPLSAADAMRRLMEDVHRGTPCADVRAAGAGDSPCAASFTGGHPPSGLVTPLPQTRPTLSIADAARRRASMRAYAPAPVSLDQVATILKAAACGDLREWPSEVTRPLAIRLLAWRVEDLAPGVYTYGTDAHALRHDGPAPDPVTEGPALTLQQEFADAAFLVFITGNLATSLATHGSAGYRLLLLRAGAAAHRASMAAVGVGLGGSIFAGFLPAAAGRYLGADGYQECCLLAYGGGRPITPGLPFLRAGDHSA